MQNGIVSKMDDSSANCVPIVQEICKIGYILDFEGKCVKSDNCTSMCPNGGKYSDANKLCVCADVSAVTCDANC